MNTGVLPASGANLALVGFRYAGKSTVGRLIARQLGREFVDTDECVERAAGQSVTDIFRIRGEAEFRRLEADAIKDACRRPGAVIAAGGGAVLSSENRVRLGAAGLCVWLTVDAAEVERRAALDSQRGTRPALTEMPFPDEVRRLIGARGPLYAEVAQVAVNSTGRTPAEVVAAIQATAEFQLWSKACDATRRT